MKNDITQKICDLRYLNWARQRNSSGTAGTFLKAYSVSETGKKLYYKLSSYDTVLGITGHESVNELISSRILDVLGYPHVKYELIHAVVRISGTEHITWLAASEDYKYPGERKIALDTYYELERKKSETPLEFMIRLGFETFVTEMTVFDFIIGNRDRHGANMEIVKNPREHSYRMSPFFDHGISLMFSCHTEEDIRNFDCLSDFKVQSFTGSTSLYGNLKLFDKKILPSIPEYTDEVKKYVFEGLNEVLPESLLDAVQRMIEERWRYYEHFKNQG